jgi:inorganic triphosphatase YgiF
MNRVTPHPPREIELKLRIGEADFARLLRHPWLAEIGEGRPATRTLRSVYFDTQDLALWQHGLVLRVRAVGHRRIVGVKTRGEARGGLVAREEYEAVLPPSTGDLREVARASLLAAIPDARMRRAIEQAEAGKPLAPRVETQVRRTTRRLRHGTAIVELALDAGEVRAGRKRLKVRELELERVSGATRALYDVALRLAADVELRPGLLGKAERGFAQLAGREPEPSRAERPVFPRGATLEAVVAAVLGECLRQVSANQDAAERGRDPEGVHQMRVGLRRLRSALRLFQAQLPVRETQALVEELRWLAGLLGTARDLDVFQEELLGPLAKGRPDDRGLALLHEAAEGARREAYATLRRELTSQRYALLVLRLGRFVDGGSFRRRGASELAQPARPLARRLLRHRAVRVKQLGARLGELSPQELHRLRIRAKRLRYATELLAPLFGDAAPARAARRLAELQDVLGHLNDQVTAEQLVARLRERLPRITPELTRAEGFVLGFAARSAALGRERLVDAWRGVERLEPFWS